MNSLKIAAALRVLALAFEADEGDNQAATPAAEPQKRGRGRPVKGEETAPAAATAGATASAVTAVTAPGTGAATTSPSDDPFATTAPAPAAPTATLDDVRTALKALQAASSQAAAVAVLKKASGAVNLGPDLTADKYGQVVAAVNAELRIINAAVKAALTPEVDPFEVPETTAPTQEKAPSLEDVKAVVVAAQKKTATDTVQKVVMSFGGKAALPDGGGEAPSLKALPVANYAAVIAAINALPATK